MSQNQVLTRRMPAIETLGSATVLCVDKTGTLTMNRMTVRKLAAGGEYFHIPATGLPGVLPEPFHELVEYSVLACEADPFDPMERAILDMGQGALKGTEHLHEDWQFQREYPLSRQLLALSHVWQMHSGDGSVAAKGAPEAILDLCHMPQERQQLIMKQVLDMANDGLRVLGVARASSDSANLPENQHDFVFTFIGLIGLADPIRVTVPAAVTQCHRAGVRVVMITGDYPGTAQSIAREIGLQRPDLIVTGRELEAMSEEEVSRKIRDVSVFARMVPEQKLRLVQALKANGEIVAMTGDGVNDAPALKNAHIGIAMGERGTDVARESASIVLLKDDFNSIVAAVRMGRRIFDNIRKAMGYILAVHVPIAGLCLIPVLLHWPLILQPVHIVFLELIIDPACSTVFEAEPEEPDVMNRPPRDRKEPLFSRRTIVLSLLQGTAVLLVTLAIYGFILNRGQGELEARSLAFTTLVIANLGLILSNRVWSKNIISSMRNKNTALFIIVAATLALLALVFSVPFLRSLFSFGPLHVNDLALCFGAGVACIVWFELVKFFSRPKTKLVKEINE